MKKLIATIFSLSLLSMVYAQAGDLFFSEYIEGSSNNKALEIFNPSDTTVSLDNYQIAQAVNGKGWQYYHIFPSGATIAPNDVWVMLNSGIDTSLVDTTIADEILSYPSVVHHNGDDARALIKITNGDTLWLDIIGDPNNDPGSGWEVAGVSNATKDHTLVRKSSVSSGNMNWAASAGTNADDSEWVVYDKDTFSYLGAHTFDGGVSDQSPSIASVWASDMVPAADTDLTVYAVVTDDNGLSSVELKFTVDGGSEATLAMSVANGDTFMVDIPASNYNDGSRVEYRVEATDDNSQMTASGTTGFFAGTSSISSIRQIDADGALLYKDYAARIMGTVTAGDSIFSLSSLQTYIQDSEAGINVYGEGMGAVNMEEGSMYQVTGKLDQYNGLAELVVSSADDIVDKGVNEDPPLPIEITIATLLASPEAFEGLLVRIANADTVAGAGTWPMDGENMNMTITDDGGTSQLTLRVDKDTNIDGSDEPTYPITVTGVISQYDRSSPYSEGYQILPRTRDDIESSTAIGDGDVVQPLSFTLYAAYPNPFNPSTTIAFDVPTDMTGKTVELSIYNVLGQKVVTLVDQNLTAGRHTAKWNGRNSASRAMPSGVYFAILKAAGQQKTSRLLLIK
ncbi:MAG TPA: T9SS type A sorting domain-containing protein [Caldithrix abyssi]|uniref:T9SS type A sorting domain-containing protein n=1 Tax=Caldithrix abyssi TaxID=187145 RepID=A0A7V5RPG0_CALAY|nr:T9SS type A sorting domain-containing protein [Caldithrix abyssi]